MAAARRRALRSAASPAVRAAAVAAEGAELDNDNFASADYKRQLATVYAQRAIEAAVGRIGA